ncbi:hypothetical protein CO174_00380 [Candidatus Uhrbacteria bacterium CG_4_9_14_3_um_filter_50_9]|uniref:Segregation and condensation protein A n=1 Tax=Candidatus Uhrbacteria bacterium CG_4_9_14_3_um_filter_50_9 TaxID=1975035 RepID=A0A2M7XEL2_9BACT|nr:MAG: hypothetical protein CO174_00380 [Candidatus Uhrbacteria bacterium CG_4_9_14_3_um_filter_50_9]
MGFEVNLAKFDGPMHVLLELIESQELPITEVSLSQVTEAYLAYIDEHVPPPEELADFLILATRLLLIKSRAILPMETEEEVEDASTLALQLRLYKEFVDASKHLELLFEGDVKSFPRGKADVVKAGGVEVSPGLTVSALQEAFSSLLKRLEPFFKLQQTALERVVSVKERLREIHDAVLSRAKMTFRDVVKGGASRIDVVVSFLALLELVKQRVVRVTQQDTFNDIEITRVD